MAPHIKSLFQGLDVTLFAYGVTGTGKTHTMRGGMKLAERGVIPRLLSNVFRRGKKIAKDTNGDTRVDVHLSYYEIYNDKVYDLLEPPEKRTPSGLPLREKDGKTMVVGLSERPCDDLKDFERLYIESNNNRVTAATKLNAHSSRSHAILRVKVTQTTPDSIRVSTASAIDLAGSEDNRRTDNGKERLVESAAINKSLFVLSQCVDAISRGDKRIPYRESKMTRILSLGQNNGITVMILNLAPIRSYHLDTLSSLNVSSRAKRIEVREIENEVVYKQAPRTMMAAAGGSGIPRQPLRPLVNAHNLVTGAAIAAKAAEKADKPVKAFSVYTDTKAAAAASKPLVVAPARTAIPLANSSQPRAALAPKAEALAARPSKLARPSQTSLPRLTQPAAAAAPQISISAAQIEAMVEKKVAEILASRAAAAAEAAPAPQPAATQPTTQAEITDQVQRRLEALERRIDSEDRHDDSRAEGLRLLLQARQAKERGNDEEALRCYEAALPSFPGQAKLLGKIERLRIKLGKQEEGDAVLLQRRPSQQRLKVTDEEEEYQEGTEGDVEDEDDGEEKQRRVKAGNKKTKKTKKVAALPEPTDGPASPRTQQLLDIINSQDLGLIRTLNGFGAKKAQDLVDHLKKRGEGGDEQMDGLVASLADLTLLPGMGTRTVERAYEGLAV